MRREVGRVRLRTVRGSRMLVERRLAEVLGSATLAQAAVDDACMRAGLSAMPDRVSPLAAFLHAHLRPVLDVALPAPEVAAFLAALEEEQRGVFGLEPSTPSTAPTSKGNRPSVEAPSGPRLAAEGLRILLVDVDTVVRSSLARTLVRLGAIVLVASTLDEARDIDSRRVHLLWCDIDAEGSVTALLDIMARSPELSVVARAHAQDLAEVTLKLTGARRHTILGRSPREAESVAAILALWREVRED